MTRTPSRPDDGRSLSVCVLRHWKVNAENARQLRLKLTVELMKPFGKDKVAEAIDKLLALQQS